MLTRNPWSSTPRITPCRVNCARMSNPLASMPEPTSSTRNAPAKIAATTRCASGPAAATAHAACLCGDTGIQRDGPSPAHPGEEHREASERIEVVSRIERHAAIAARRRVAATQRDGRMAELVDHRSEQETWQRAEDDRQVGTGVVTRRRLLELDPRRPPRALRFRSVIVSVRATGSVVSWLLRVVLDDRRQCEQQLTLSDQQMPLRIGWHESLKELPSSRDASSTRRVACVHTASVMACDPQRSPRASPRQAVPW